MPFLECPVASTQSYLGLPGNLAYGMRREAEVALSQGQSVGQFRCTLSGGESRMILCARRSWDRKTYDSAADAYREVSGLDAVVGDIENSSLNP